MKTIKPYIHVPKEVIDAQLTRTRLINDKTNIYDNNSEKVSHNRLTRSHELVGAGIDYLCDFTEYMCTHEQKYITILDDDPDFDLIRADFEVYKDIASGRIPGQRTRIVKEALRYYTKPKSVYIPLLNGNYLLSYPFIITFEKTDAIELPPSMIQKLKNIDTDRKIGIINIRFSKYLFRPFLERKTQWRQMPSGIYAKLYDMQQKEEQDRQKRKKLINNPESRPQLKFLGLSDKQIDDAIRNENIHRTRLDDGRYIAAIKAFFYAVTDKYNESKDYISLPFIELLEKTNRDLLTTKAGQRIPKNNHHVGIFIESAINKMKTFKEFDFEIQRFDHDPAIPQNIRFHIIHRKHK
jgi:hypothetical protein